VSETIVNIHEAKTHLSRLIERVEAGETIIIAKAGTPKVILSPVPTLLPRKPGRHAGRIHFAADCFDAMNEEELREIEEGHPDDPMRVLVQGKGSPEAR
jgi:prevent-host-death family protein